MSTLHAVLILGPILLLVLTGLVPSRYANENVRRIRTFVTLLSGLQFALAAFAAVLALPTLLGSGSSQLSEASWAAGTGLPLSLHYDGFACLMLTLVSFVGFVVTKYSIRYLDGEPTQGRYFRWVALTIGAVSLLVVSGNLLLFFAAWVLTSFGLHQLLLHYPERAAARRAAWTKFTISRAGDVFLLSAIVLVYRTFGTFELNQIFTMVDAPEYVGSPAVTWIAWLFMLGAVTKSAQFPLHTWLPETMETPTPVSALMHAGIVNAGGYLVIRVSPIVVHAPWAMATLALIGTVTVCFAGIVMTTQSSIKRKLAYSTIAQMGFMMLQCGLGAFAAAMLHILAHSLYKAHAFLSSGSVMSSAAGMRKPKAAVANEDLRSSLPTLLAAMTLAIASVALAATYFGVQLAGKPGGCALAFVLCMALVVWLFDVLKLQSLVSSVTAIVVAATLAMLYFAGYVGVDRIVSASLPEVTSTALSAIVVADVVIAFCGLFVLQWILSTSRGRDWLQPLYVHAFHGFYIGAIVRRVVGTFNRKRATPRTETFSPVV